MEKENYFTTYEKNVQRLPTEIFKVTNGVSLRLVGENFYNTKEHDDLDIHLPSRYLLILSQQWQTPEQCVKSVKNWKKDTKTIPMKPFWSFYSWLETDFPHCSGVSIAEYKHVNVGRVNKKLNFTKKWKLW